MVRVENALCTFFLPQTKLWVRLLFLYTNYTKKNPFKGTVIVMQRWQCPIHNSTLK